MDPIVSVVMPVYNGEAYLAEAIEGVLSQTIKNIELVAVDDGSQDSSWTILQSFAEKDERIVLVRNQTNQGHRYTSNLAHGIARGEFLARNDQDDLSHPSRLERQLDFFYRNQNVGLLACSYKSLYSNGRVVVRTPSGEHLINRWRLLFGMVFSHSSLMFRRSLLSTEDLSFRFAPAAYDYEICARLARKTQIGCLREPLVTYRIHTTGLSSTSRDKMECSANAISRRELRLLVGRSTFHRHVLDGVRRLATARNLKNQDLKLVPQLMQIIKKFQEVESADERTIHFIRRSWMKKFLRRAAPGQLIGLLVQGNLLQEMNSDWFPALTMTAKAFPRSCARRVLGQK